jgi:hypothetical protein
MSKHKNVKNKYKFMYQGLNSYLLTPQTHCPANIGSDSVIGYIQFPVPEAAVVLCTDISCRKIKETSMHTENTYPVSHTLHEVRLHLQSSPFCRNLLSGISE